MVTEARKKNDKNKKIMYFPTQRRRKNEDGMELWFLIRLFWLFTTTFYVV